MYNLYTKSLRGKKNNNKEKRCTTVIHNNENGKKAIGLDWQNNNFARFSVHFLAVVARLQRETSYFHVLSRT